MINIAIAADSPLVEDQAVQLRRAIIASTIGTMIEWYDFYIYGIVTGLVFGKLFFPESEPLTGTLQAFGVYAVGFISRPIGAAIFGHYGDRIGRKSTLIATLMLMGIATFLVAGAYLRQYRRLGGGDPYLLAFHARGRRRRRVGRLGAPVDGVVQITWAPRLCRGVAAIRLARR